MGRLQEQRVHDFIEAALINGQTVAQLDALNAERGEAGKCGGRGIGVEAEHTLASGDLMLCLEAGGQRFADPTL
jgi:hypothetical protein